MRPTAVCLAVAEDAAPDKPLAGNRSFRLVRELQEASEGDNGNA